MRILKSLMILAVGSHIAFVYLGDILDTVRYQMAQVRFGKALESFQKLEEIDGVLLIPGSDKSGRICFVWTPELLQSAQEKTAVLKELFMAASKMHDVELHRRASNYDALRTYYRLTKSSYRLYALYATYLPNDNEDVPEGEVCYSGKSI